MKSAHTRQEPLLSTSAENVRPRAKKKPKKSEPSSPPNVFICSSSSALQVAAGVQKCLEHHCSVTLWKDSIEPTQYTLDGLIQRIEKSDFVVAILSADDQTNRRGLWVTRDNVLLETGMAYAIVGKDRTFLVRTQKDDAVPRYPSDLHGVTYAPIGKAGGHNIRAASNKILKIIKRLKKRERPGYYVLCRPSTNAMKDEFGANLCASLSSALGGRLPMVVRAASQSKTRVRDNIQSFHEQVREIGEYSTPPSALIVIWPGICVDENPAPVLNVFRHLLEHGCKIALINEFPPFAGYEDVRKGVLLIRLNESQAAQLLCGEVKKTLDDRLPAAVRRKVLVVSATQSFDVACKRRLHTLKTLATMDVLVKEVIIDSWDQSDSYRIVRKELESHDWEEGRFYDVVMAANDSMAKGAVDAIDKYCKENDRSIPTQVTGFDGLPSVRRLIEKPNGRFMATIDASPALFVERALDQFRSRRYEGLTTVSMPRTRLLSRESDH